MTEDIETAAREAGWLKCAESKGISPEFASVPNGSQRLSYEAGWRDALAWLAETRTVGEQQRAAYWDLVRQVRAGIDPKGNGASNA